MKKKTLKVYQTPEIECSYLTADSVLCQETSTHYASSLEDLTEETYEW